MEDSFCVGEEEEEEEETYIDGEDTLLISKKNNYPKSRRRTSVKQICAKSSKLEIAAGWQRIRRPIASSSDDESPSKRLTVVPSPKIPVPHQNLSTVVTSPTHSGFTQMPSLQSRCRNNLNSVVKSSSSVAQNSRAGQGHDSSDEDDSLLAQIEIPVPRDIADNPINKLRTRPNQDVMVGGRDYGHARISVNPNPEGSVPVTGKAAGLSGTEVSPPSQPVQPVLGSPTLSKEERLRRSRLKQQEFQQKMRLKLQQQQQQQQQPQNLQQQNQLEGLRSQEQKQLQQRLGYTGMKMI